SCEPAPPRELAICVVVDGSIPNRKYPIIAIRPTPRPPPAIAPPMPRRSSMPPPRRPPIQRMESGPPASASGDQDGNALDGGKMHRAGDLSEDGAGRTG